MWQISTSLWYHTGLGDPRDGGLAVQGQLGKDVKFRFQNFLSNTLKTEHHPRPASGVSVVKSDVTLILLFFSGHLRIFVCC